MAHANRIRVFVLHGDPIARAGLSATFGRYADLEVLNADDDEDDAPSPLRLPDRHSADVVVADYENGVELAAQGSRRGGAGNSLKVMIVAATDREWEIRSALESGVRGYVVVGCALDELAAGVRAVYRGVRHLSAPVAQRLAESLSGDALTGREEEVLRLVVKGMGNKATARQLGIAVGTVKSHLKGIFDKLNVESRTQAISAAERRGLLRDAPPAARPSVTAESTLGVRPRLSNAYRHAGNEAPVSVGS